MLTFVSGLDFLNGKARVIHGDLSMNNIMIGRVWPKGSAQTPSQLRNIACNSNASDTVSDGGRSPTSQPDLTIVGAPVVDSLAGPNPDPPSVSDAVDHTGTCEAIESSGMLIDFDFMRYTNDNTHMASVRSFVSTIFSSLANIL